MNRNVKQKSATKVYVRMHDGSRMLGSVFLAEDERLQDIMNDSRGFIPVHVEDQNTVSLVMLAKRYIQQIEEVKKESRRREPSRDQPPPRREQPVPEERPQVVAAPKGELKLELEKPFSGE